MSAEVEQETSHDAETMDDDPDNFPIYDPKDHGTVFNPGAYLSAFYSSADDDSAMKMMLFFLPGMAYRLPEGGSLLDIGSGPTVHVAFTFRERVDAIYLSDFAAQNRRELVKWWLEEEDCFQWTEILNWLRLIEAKNKPGPAIDVATREKIQAILACDVLEPNVIDLEHSYPTGVTVPSQFDLITSIFCLEYATNCSRDYNRAMQNVSKLLKPGGHLLLGGVLEETCYYFGKCKFRCHFLTKKELFKSLADAGLDTDANSIRFIVYDSVFIVLAKKL